MENTEYLEVTSAALGFHGQITAKIGYKSYEKEIIMLAEEGMLVGEGWERKLCASVISEAKNNWDLFNSTRELGHHVKSLKPQLQNYLTYECPRKWMSNFPRIVKTQVK